MPRACPSGDERVTLFGLLADTNARLQKVISAGLADDCGMSLPALEALLLLRRHPEGRVLMHELADGVVLSNGGATRLVDRLVDDDLVERVHCPHDRRAMYVAITATGNARLDEALAVHVAQLEETLGHPLTATERRTLATLLSKIQRAL
jgi:DNA-binding MarR family transcriptional regulator